MSSLRPSLHSTPVAFRGARLSTLNARRLTPSVVLVAIGMLLVASPEVSATALDDYIAKPDSSYQYTIESTVPGPGYTAYIVDMTSQTWRDPSEITNRTEWQHYMQIIKPTVVTSNTAALVISGGSNSGSPPSVDSDLVAAALATGTVVAEVPTIPNQSLQFAGEGFTRREDEIIAKTFRLFLDGDPEPDPEWPLLLPMTKSAVRAMDTVVDLMGNNGVTVNDFMVTGASKRGWTTWLTAAVDDRVSAIAPMVIDVLNMEPQMLHHRAHYEDVTTGLTANGYSNAIHDYDDEGILAEFGNERMQELLGIVDPFSYRERLDMPKYLISSTGDEFFVPDSAQFYFDELSGPKYLRYVPNTGHGLNSEAVNNLVGFFQAHLNGSTLPEFSWTVEDGGTTIRVDTVDAPETVEVWQATNPSSRDFRNSYTSVNWTSSDLDDPDEDGVYVAQVVAPASGATAFMVELTYDVDGLMIPFTTRVSVVSELIFADVNGDGVVNGLDMNIVSAHADADGSGATFAEGDVNRNGTIDALDARAIGLGWGRGTTPLVGDGSAGAAGAAGAVPEPTTLALVILGLVTTMLTRRLRPQ